MPRMLYRLVPVFLPIAMALVLSSCACIRDGVIVEKKSRGGLPNVYAVWTPQFRYEPDLYWVTVEGRTRNGGVARRSIILFRNDWVQLREGDRWDCDRGFAPAEAFPGK